MPSFSCLFNLVGELAYFRRKNYEFFCASMRLATLTYVYLYTSYLFIIVYS